MDLKQLNTFHRVATVMSFTRAAAELQYAQSSVTAQVKGLELSLGVDLFERLRGKIQLTPAGERLVPYAERVLTLVDEARYCTAGRSEPAGTLTIGTVESLTSYRMPPVLEFFHHRYPRLQLALQPSTCEEACEALRKGVLDMGFLMSTETRYPGIESEVLGTEQLVAVAAADHPLAGVTGVTTRDLSEVPVLAPGAGCAYRGLFETALNEHAPEPVELLEFGNLESVKRGIAAGLGVSVLPAVAVVDEVASHGLRVLDWKPPFEVHTQIAWRRGRRPTPEMRIFIDQITRFIAQDEVSLAS